MLDYVFFDDGGLGRFVAFLEEHRIASEQRDDSLGGRIVSVAEDLPDEILDAVEDRYDALMAEQSAMAELDESLVKTRVVGIQVSLADGSLRTVELDAGNRQPPARTLHARRSAATRGSHRAKPRSPRRRSALPQEIERMTPRRLQQAYPDARRRLRQRHANIRPIDNCAMTTPEPTDNRVDVTLPPIRQVPVGRPLRWLPAGLARLHPGAPAERTARLSAGHGRRSPSCFWPRAPLPAVRRLLQLPAGGAGAAHRDSTS
ncbi:MAG: hypothetical protein MZW92_78770 [Comamonadaceae bacterium]|nr:hypothetical protein [Comamonadaceae bacterium]